MPLRSELREPNIPPVSEQDAMAIPWPESPIPPPLTDEQRALAPIVPWWLYDARFPTEKKTTGKLEIREWVPM